MGETVQGSVGNLLQQFSTVAAAVGEGWVDIGRAVEQTAAVIARAAGSAANAFVEIVAADRAEPRSGAMSSNQWPRFAPSLGFATDVLRTPYSFTALTAAAEQYCFDGLCTASAERHSLDGTVYEDGSRTWRRQDMSERVIVDLYHPDAAYYAREDYVGVGRAWPTRRDGAVAVEGGVRNTLQCRGNSCSFEIFAQIMFTWSPNPHPPRFDIPSTSASPLY